MRMQRLIIHQKFMRVACCSKVFLFIYSYLNLGKQVQIIIFPVWYTEKKRNGSESKYLNKTNCNSLNRTSVV